MSRMRTFRQENRYGDRIRSERVRLGFTQAELKQLTPITEALTERYRGLAHDLADLYVGRMNRSNLERFANNFFVAWPVSYMIKVTGWAYKVLFEKLGPVHGNAGAYLWNEYRKQYEKLLQNDSDFANWAEENPDFLFAVEMLMPVTPVSIGASLNKTTRYVGNWITQQALDDPSAAPFGDYTPDSVPALLESSFRFGPFRTYNLVKNSLKSFGVPGFYEEPKGNQIPQYP